MHQYVDKPRLHANYSLTELIFVIVAKSVSYTHLTLPTNSLV